MVIGLYLCLAVGYQVSIPMFEAPDEPSHVEYVGFVHANARPPAFGNDPEVPGEGMQAPAYYLLSAPLFGKVVADPVAFMAELHRANREIYRYDADGARLNREIRPVSRRLFRKGTRRIWPNARLDSVRAIRAPNLAFGLATLLLCFSAVRRAAGDVRLATIASAILTLNPQFLFVSGYVNNDVAAAAVGAAAFCALAFSLSGAGPRRVHYVWLGAIAGIGILVKTSSLTVSATACLVLFAADPRPLRRRVSDAALAGALVISLASPYFAWNLENRGDWLGMTAVWDSATHLSNLHVKPDRIWRTLLANYPKTFQSYWGLFGWMTVQMPTAVYAILAGSTLFCVVRFARSVRENWVARGRLQNWVLLYLLAASVAMIGAHVWLNTSVASLQGRHLFPAIAQISTILAVGLAGRRFPSLRSVGIVVAAMGSLAVYALLGVLRPAYAATAVINEVVG